MLPTPIWLTPYRRRPHPVCATDSPCRRPRIPSFTNNVNQQPRYPVPLQDHSPRRPATAGGRLYGPTTHTVNPLSQNPKPPPPPPQNTQSQ